LALLALLIALGGLTVGCQEDFTEADVYRDLSPELETIGLTSAQRRNRSARTIDTNLRAFNDDLDHFLLFDRPARIVSGRPPVP
jgi:hypothetical protein